jgi:hypothetical protein
MKKWTMIKEVLSEALHAPHTWVHEHTHTHTICTHLNNIKTREKKMPLTVAQMTNCSVWHQGWERKGKQLVGEINQCHTHSRETELLCHIQKESQTLFWLNKQYQVILYFGDTAYSIRNSEANSSVYIQLKWNMEARSHIARFEVQTVVFIKIQVFWIRWCMTG